MPALNVKIWNQLNDPGPSGVDAQEYYDCGEECVSMVMEACTGQYTTEGQVRQGTPGHVWNVGTDGKSLETYLTGHGCPATVAYPGVQDMLNIVRYRFQQGYPTLVLGRFLDQFPKNLHWVVVVDVEGDQIGYNDPWGGRRQYVSSGWFASRYNQQIATPQIVQVNVPVKGHKPAPGPSPSPRGNYTVKAGDTFSQIAVAHGVSVAALQGANPEITNPGLIRVGQIIKLP
jgi:hypothetical protein